MNYKNIDEKYHQKTMYNFHTERCRKDSVTVNLYSDEYKGCLFVYDDLFKESFEMQFPHWRL
jgi:hypothetical protein